MKITKYLIIAVIAFVGVSVFAQDLKFGHVDVQVLISQLPEKIDADKKLEKEAESLRNNLEVMTKDLDTKYNEYMASRDTLSELIRATKEKEIQDYDQRIKNFNMLAQQQLQKKEQDLLQPIIEKVQKAIDEVGAENGLIYIFDISSRVVLYHSDKSLDCAPLVRTKLGVQ
ncbi:MAG: OmpH family outer membrane protein [Marinilabiliaceae bacterium]|nr:OmpH family outer membrane protein [Marinilabiliaceae bacterium]